MSPSNQTILVTGASGFVAAHVLIEFLEAGYRVRGTVRSEATADKIRQTHGKYGDALSFAIVPDIIAPGAFDEAVKGVDGVIHTASPFILNAVDYEKELYTPALRGTLEVLQSVKKYAPQVKRVVVTSSFASIVDVTKGVRPGYVYIEADWNPMTTEEAKSFGPAAAYLVSKTIAEKAAFEFVKNEHPNFTVSTVCPPMVYGPIAHYVSSMSKLNTSSADVYRLINGTTSEMPETEFWGCIDVRDLALSHRLAYEKEVAANQRYLVTMGNYSYQQFVDIIREKYPQLKDKLPLGHPGEPFPDVYKYDTSKVQKELGMKFRGLEEIVVSTVDSLLELEKKLGA